MLLLLLLCLLGLRLAVLVRQLSSGVRLGCFWAGLGRPRPPSTMPMTPPGPAGNAVLFWDTKLGSMRQDKFSLHTGCPVLKGTKW